MVVFEDLLEKPKLQNMPLFKAVCAFLVLDLLEPKSGA